MNKQEQIEKIANDLRDLDNLQYNPNYTANYQRAVGLYSLGYRKQGDTAREIFAELKTVMMDEYRYPIIAELKQKYGVEDNYREEEKSTDV